MPKVANRTGFSGGDRSRGRFTTPADSIRQDKSRFSGLHVHRQRLGFVHRSMPFFCRPAPNPRFDSQRLHRCPSTVAYRKRLRITLLREHSPPLPCVPPQVWAPGGHRPGSARTPPHPPCPIPTSGWQSPSRFRSTVCATHAPLGLGNKREGCGSFPRPTERTHLRGLYSG